MNGRVLRDAESDRVLERDGFVKSRILPASEASKLRDEFGLLRGWEGVGAASDLAVDDPTYRVAADRCIAASLDARVAAMFDGFVPFSRSFLCKHPGADSELGLRRDWMHVDERQGHRTYVAWVALEDIDGDNGQLRVLRASHQLDPMLRGTDLSPSWLAHEQVIRRRLLSVPLKAGEGIIFDSALVHCSYPNHTERPSLAVAVGLAPMGVPLVHFRRADAVTAERFDVDPSFYLSVTPEGLIASPPDLPVAERVEVAGRALGAAELAGELDRGALARLDRVQSALARWRPRSADVDALASRTRSLSSAKWDDARRAGRAARERADHLAAQLPSKAAIAVLAANEAVIDRFGPDHPAVWDPSTFEWSARVEAAYPQIRAEVEALLAGPTEIPHIEDVTGGIPQGNVGPWRSFVLMHQGRWIDWNCDRCPETTRVVRSIPGLTMAGFSVLEPGTHITEHRGPNKGALRHQLGVIVPGAPGDCRIRVGDEMLHWHDGESVMFDFTVPHEAWNDTGEIRVLLMLEVVTPLPWYLDKPNRLAQRAMGWFPTTRDMRRRLAALEPTLHRRESA